MGVKAQMGAARGRDQGWQPWDVRHGPRSSRRQPEAGRPHARGRPGSKAAARPQNASNPLHPNAWRRRKAGVAARTLADHGTLGFSTAGRTREARRPSCPSNPPLPPAGGGKTPQAVHSGGQRGALERGGAGIGHAHRLAGRWVGPGPVRRPPARTPAPTLASSRPRVGRVQNMGAHRPTSPRPLKILPAECKRVWNRDVAARRSRPLVQGALHWPSLAGVAGEAATPPQARTGRPAGGPRLRARRRPRSRQQRAVSSGSGPPTAPLLPCQQPGRWEDSHVLPRLRAGRNRRMPRLRTQRVHFTDRVFSVFVCLLTHHPLSPKLIFLTSSHKGACRHRRGWGAEPRSQERGGGGMF